MVSGHKLELERLRGQLEVEFKKEAELCQQEHARILAANEMEYQTKLEKSRVENESLIKTQK